MGGDPSGDLAVVGPTLLGIDAGASTLKIAWCAPSGVPLHRAAVACQGQPSAALSRLLDDMPAELPGDRGVTVAVTGSGHALHQFREAVTVNEVVATARGVRALYPQARTIIDLGGQFSKLILLDPDPARPGSVADFASNGLCAAGAGAFLEQQASRLGLSVKALGRLAATARRGASIAGRCSVFAKSDMIHLQQKGTPPEEIA